jgi:hypothetical protein
VNESAVGGLGRWGARQDRYHQNAIVLVVSGMVNDDYGLMDRRQFVASGGNEGDPESIHDGELEGERERSCRGKDGTAARGESAPSQAQQGLNGRDVSRREQRSQTNRQRSRCNGSAARRFARGEIGKKQILWMDSVKGDQLDGGVGRG